MRRIHFPPLGQLAGADFVRGQHRFWTCFLNRRLPCPPLDYPKPAAPFARGARPTCATNCFPLHRRAAVAWRWQQAMPALLAAFSRRAPTRLRPATGPALLTQPADRAVCHSIHTRRRG